ncbi:phage baseplate assembly protein [Methyloversatilis sp. XJ19-13]|uniref:phage baseplate assembly protein domain-containing protein n=1 Tax=Methyloversatilis sp. XJ19-13 TaxID=2963430 RepID=UPI00211CFA16|nr:phage baseplate assembly protein [Methyloversatilis sp. XJ19-13]MCQ9375145.1 phage baseplate assembly protein [Methyloversatilis sp. XJ19-13]
MRREISRALSGMRQAFRGVVGSYRHRAAGPMLARAEGLADEQLVDVEIMQQAGLVSGLPAGTPVIVLPIGGKTAQSVIIASEHGTYRVQVAPGEVALYHLTEPNCSVHLKAGRIVELKCDKFEISADTEVTITAPILRVSDDIEVRSAGAPYSVNAFLAAYNGHKHTETGSITTGPDSTV